MERIILSGNWKASGGKHSNLAAQVPGCIHTDLMDNGLIEDTYYRDKETNQMWIGGTVRKFKYRITLKCLLK